MRIKLLAERDGARRMPGMAAASADRAAPLDHFAALDRRRLHEPPRACLAMRSAMPCDFAPDRVRAFAPAPVDYSRRRASRLLRRLAYGAAPLLGVALLALAAYDVALLAPLR